MADIGRPRKPGYAVNSKAAFWASTAMSANQETIVPGVNSAGNMRKPRVKGGKTKEVRAYVPLKQPVVETTDSHGNKTSVGMMSDISTIETDLSNLKNKQVSLRDLCVEDKKRVANLIKELARVVDEKDSAEQNLASERNHYQEQILKLVEQQETILKEREDVQQKLLEYQNLIVKLQQEQQQEKQRKLQLRSPEKETRTEDEPKTLKGSNDEKNTKSRLRENGSHKDRQAIEGVNPHPDPKINDDEGSDYDDDADDRSEGENDNNNNAPIELPSQNLYMNILDETDVEEFSTRALPALSPPPPKEVRPKPSSYRPFTAMIDKELARQQAALSAAGFGSPDGLDLGKKKETTSTRDAEKVLLHGETSPGHKPKPTTHSLKELNSQEKISSGYHEEKGREHDHEMPEGVLDANFVFPSHALVSPEKAAIFSRFMDSHHRDLCDTERERAERVGREAVRDRKEKAADLHERRKQKKKKRPPAAFGGFHPPVMSSTQKSSEFGDYADSSMNSERKLVEAKHQPEEAKAEENTYSGDRVINAVNGKPGRRLRDEAADDEWNDADRWNGGRSYKEAKMSKQKGKTRVEFSDMDAGCQATAPESDGQLDLNSDYLSYYKKLSGSERKKELLMQRSKLLEEQNNLKKILAEQEHKLKVRQAGATTKMDAMEGTSDGDKLLQKKMQNSLEEMELRLAEKEEAIKREREILEQKRKNQLDQRNSKVPPMETDTAQDQERDSHRQTHMPQSEMQVTAGVTSTKKAFEHDKREALGVESGKKPKAGVDVKDLQTKKPASGSERKKADSTCAKGVKDKTEEDLLARKLDYSFHSDAGLPGINETGEVEPAKDGTADGKLGKASTGHTAEGCLPQAKVDAGTSMSFHNLDKSITDVPQKAQPRNVDAGRSPEKLHRRKHLSESPGEKTLAVIEIINSLDDDLDTIGTSPSIKIRTNSKLMQDQKGTNKRTTLLKSHSAKISPGSGEQKSTQKQLSQSLAPAQHIRPLPHLNFRPDRHLQSNSRSGSRHFTALGTRRPAQPDDAELDLFHLPQFREERLDGFRRLANRETDDDDDSDDVVYEYDENDDSNLDDIVNALSASLSNGAEETEEFDGEEGDVWDTVVNDLNSVCSLKVRDNLDVDTSSFGDLDRLSLSSDRRKKECADDSEILEEVFFINP